MSVPQITSASKPTMQVHWRARIAVAATVGVPLGVLLTSSPADAADWGNWGGGKTFTSATASKNSFEPFQTDFSPFDSQTHSTWEMDAATEAAGFEPFVSDFGNSTDFLGSGLTIADVSDKVDVDIEPSTATRPDPFDWRPEELGDARTLLGFGFTTDSERTETATGGLTEAEVASFNDFVDSLKAPTLHLESINRGANHDDAFDENPYLPVVNPVTDLVIPEDRTASNVEQRTVNGVTRTTYTTASTSPAQPYVYFSQVAPAGSSIGPKTLTEDGHLVVSANGFEGSSIVRLFDSQGELVDFEIIDKVVVETGAQQILSSEIMTEIDLELADGAR